MNLSPAAFGVESWVGGHPQLPEFDKECVFLLAQHLVGIRPGERPHWRHQRECHGYENRIVCTRQGDGPPTVEMVTGQDRGQLVWMHWHCADALADGRPPPTENMARLADGQAREGLQLSICPTPRHATDPTSENGSPTHENPVVDQAPDRDPVAPGTTPAPRSMQKQESLFLLVSPGLLDPAVL